MSQTKVIKYPSGVVLTRTFDSESEVWEIDNQALSIASFTLDISECEGVYFNGDEDSTSKTIKVQSKEKNVDLKLTKTSPWRMKVSFNLQETPLSLTEQKKAIDSNRGDKKKEIEDNESVFKKIPYEILDQNEIIKRMREIGATNFIDPHFPPKNISLYNVVTDKYPFDFVVQWRRPHEFMEDPQLFVDDIDPNDIKQGQLGDCWFLSALSSLAERPGMVRRLFITQEYNKEGIYKIKLCKNGEWVTVTIDDYIPCRYNGGPMFSRSCNNELWVMLIEKAYAKLHGNYQALSQGFTKHAMVDLTGCPTEYKAFPTEKNNFEEVEDFANEIFDYLVSADNEGHLILTETSGTDEITEGDGPGAGAGLVSGHAYSIIQVKEGNGVKLLNIRNPWGQFEWNGAWSDNSKEWTDDMINEFNPVFDANDGSFWMCLEDFMMKFDAVNICKIENYNEVRFKGKFIKCTLGKERFESVISKFVYKFDIQEETTITVGIHQEDERIVGAHLRRNMDVGFVVLKKDEDEEEVHFVAHCPFSREREVFHSVTLEEGSYIIVPLTTGGCIQKTANSNSTSIPNKFEFEGTVYPHPYFSSTMNDIFRKLDLAVNQSLSAQELNQFGHIIGEKFYTEIKQSDFTSEKFKDISCNSDGVSCLGFKQLFFRSFSNAEITQKLEKLGYDAALNSLKSRVFMVSIQASDEINVKISDVFEGNFHSTAWEQLLKHIFEEEGPGDYSLERDDYTLFVYPNNEAYTCSFGAINHTEEPIEVSMDLSNSKSCLYSPNSGISTRVIPPETMKYMGSLSCDPDATSFSYSFKAKTKNAQAQDDEQESEPQDSDE